LLRRVHPNLIQNTLKGSSPGQTVTLSLTNEGVPTFPVHNLGVMEEETRLQVFQRSFSSKAEPGRGIGVYSAKLLTEKYLHGSVSSTPRPGEEPLSLCGGTLRPASRYLAALAQLKPN
jgi:sensor histidine kinase regulating citrate/malate metabolism